MPPKYHRSNICLVGGNAVSAFLSWRLQATNACDVTLVWKQDFENVAQYGITMRSSIPKLGNERFKPRAVVRTPEEAQRKPKLPFDYVLLCVKALPDVYDIAAVIESVVTPQHTCILLNTTFSLGIESYLEERFPSNVLLSLVCGADLVQLGSSEFELRGESTDLWVGWAIRNPAIPEAIQRDMAEALAMTLKSSNVECTVSENIRQQQFEKMIGPIAFYPTSVMLESPNHAELIQKVGARATVCGIIDELIEIATAYDCKFPPNFRDQIIEQQTQPSDKNSSMYQDFLYKRPMEVETFLGSPIRMAKDRKIAVPRIEMMYSMFHNKNTANLASPREPSAPSSPVMQNPPPRSSSVTGSGPRPIANGGMPNGMANGVANGMTNGMANGVRPPRGQSLNGPPGTVRRGPPPTNGYGGRMPNGNGPQYGNGRPSMESNDLQEFSHLVLYDTAPEGNFPEGGYGEAAIGSSNTDLALRERELAIRERELALERQRMQMMRRRGGPRPPPSRAGTYYDDDDDDDGDFFDPMTNTGPPPAVVDDNFDMMSVTSRRTRKVSSGNIDRFQAPSRNRNPFGRNRNRTSTTLMRDIPGLSESIMENALMGYSTNRYGTVERQVMGHETRQNSLTQSRLNELGRGGPYPGYPQRRTSQSPRNPTSPGQMSGPMGPPPNGYGPPNGMPNGRGNGRPSPPGGMRAPPPRAPSRGNNMDPYQYQASVGVSNPNMLKQNPQVRSLTGSASASAGSGDSGASAHLDSEPSATSSQSSLGARPRLGIRS